MQRRFATLIFAAALLSGFVPTALALPKAADLLKAKLLADVSTIEPGRPFTLGVLMKMSPKWHVYWINPGDSGLPPAIEWRLPSGFIVGELQFPVPARIDLPGGLVNYGYLDEVLLTAKVTPPKDLAAGTSLPIDSNVSFLVCNEDNCVPGEAKLHLDLIASAATTAANEELFKTWAARLPTSDANTSIRQSWQATQEGNGAMVSFIVDFPADAKAEKPEWFAAPGENLVIKNVRIDRPDKHQARVMFTLEPVAGQKLPGKISFPAVLAYSDKGEPRGMSVSVQIDLNKTSPTADAQPAGR